LYCVFVTQCLCYEDISHELKMKDNKMAQDFTLMPSEMESGTCGHIWCLTHPRTLQIGQLNFGTRCNTSQSNGVSVSKSSLLWPILLENSKSVPEGHRDVCPVDLSWGGSVGNVDRILLNGDFQHREDKVRVCGSKRRPLGRYVSVYWRWTSLWCLTDDGLLGRITQWIRVQFPEFKCRWAVGGNSHHLRTAKVLYHNQ